jgi:uncharacterized protein (DUF305 family)
VGYSRGGGGTWEWSLELMKQIVQRRLPAMLMVLATCGAVAACASGSRTASPQESAGGEPADAHVAHAVHPAHAAHEPAAAAATAADQHVHEHAHGDALPATAGPGHTVADVHFMQMMIGHHAQALLMTELVPGRGADGRLLRLAQKIDISQRDEIDMMRQWLVERGQAVPTDDHVHSMQMPGMVTEAQLAQLAASRGNEFDRLFLRLMIQHHDGAVEMVDALFASPGAAQDSDIFRFATDVSADQLDEIGVMQHMLELLETSQGA